jgi:hypothetical protein
MFSRGLSVCRQQRGGVTARIDQNAQLFDKLRRFRARRTSTGQGIFAAELRSY